MLRLKPDPLPRIQPVPEYLADARLKSVYEDTKSVLRVPWMGVVTMAFARYPTFYDTLWGAARDVCRSTEFGAACRVLREHAEAAAVPLGPERLRAALVAQGYADREIDEIRDLIEVFSQGNMPYLMLATLARLLLDGFDVGRGARIGPDVHPASASAAPPLTLIEPHHADAPTVAVYRDIMDTLGLPFVNTDYRALARWPSYFALAWGDLRDKIRHPDYDRAVHSVHQCAVERWHELPVPAGLTSERLRAAATRDAAIGEVADVVRLFQWLLPGLVTNVAYLRAQLAHD